ncbi:flavodoxin family protein [Methanobacterium alcaliphilum]|uniref:flavodoxin family protein n=1 Tax=Methanobacterium alcaliphilum TaxID=392018 RepID=UPI00200AB403|nr:flavodoxin family protein [Methanobacterium alcaliphilum]MCK9151392.1 flavodoxin family protein [Methanobacterium alcaliphilum]
MKTAIIYKSIHHGNTQKIAEVMSETLKADLFDLKDVDPNITQKYDLIGFGSGIYYYRPHKKLRKFIEELETLENKKAFTFITSGNGKPNQWLNKKLTQKGFEVIGNFNCKGFDTYGPMKLVGGHNKGRPNEEDIKNAESFANNLKSKF